MITKQPNTLYIDFETFSAIELKDCGADVYARDESTGVWCAGFAINDDPLQLWVKGERCPPEILVAIHDNYRIVAHNVPFEWLIWNYVLTRPEYNWPKLNIENCDCTMVRAYAMALPGSLDGASKSIKLKHEKDAKAGRVMLQLAKPKKDGTFHTPQEYPDKFKILYDYCLQDVEVERALDKTLLPLSPNERKIWLLDHKINQRGISVDLKVLKAALKIVELESVRLMQELQTVTGNQVATYNAHAQFKAWMKTYGIIADSVDKEAVTKYLADPQTPLVVKQALKIRQEAAKSSTAKFSAMILGACKDGKLRSMFQYHGANTGRWAGRRVQLQNLPRPTSKQQDIDAIFKLLEGVTYGAQ